MLCASLHDEGSRWTLVVNAIFFLGALALLRWEWGGHCRRSSAFERARQAMPDAPGFPRHMEGQI